MPTNINVKNCIFKFPKLTQKRLARCNSYRSEFVLLSSSKDRNYLFITPPCVPWHLHQCLTRQFAFQEPSMLSNESGTTDHHLLAPNVVLIEKSIVITILPYSVTLKGHEQERCFQEPPQVSFTPTCSTSLPQAFVSGVGTVQLGDMSTNPAKSTSHLLRFLEGRTCKTQDSPQLGKLHETTDSILSISHYFHEYQHICIKNSYLRN